MLVDLEVLVWSLFGLFLIPAVPSNALWVHRAIFRTEFGLRQLAGSKPGVRVSNESGNNIHVHRQTRAVINSLSGSKVMFTV